MSHNLTDVEGHQQNRDGTITALASTDLSDVSGSPASTEALTYSGAGWAPAAGPVPNQEPNVVATLGGYVASFALGTTKQRGAGNFYYWGYSNTNNFKVNGYHDLVHATWLTTSGGVAWTHARTIEKLQLTAGTYLMKMQHITYSGSSSPYIDLQWQTDAGTKLGPIGRIGTKDQPGSVYGIAVLASTTILGLNIIASSGNNMNPYGSTASNQLFNQKLQATIVRLP